MAPNKLKCLHISGMFLSQKRAKNIPLAHKFKKLQHFSIFFAFLRCKKYFFLYICGNLTLKNI